MIKYITYNTEYQNMSKEPTKKRFNSVVEKIRTVLPESYKQENRVEDFNHTFTDTEEDKSIGILWLNPSTSEPYFELDKYRFDGLPEVSSETFNTEDELLNYIEEKIN